MVRKTLRAITSKISGLHQAAFWLAGFSILSQVLAFLRDRLLAHYFGAGTALDIYYTAFRIPDLIYNLMIVGALSAAFIPVFTELVSEKEENRAWKLVSGVMSLQILLTGFVSLVLS